MPQSSSSSTYRPQYIPAFQPDSNGVMFNNSAQTMMHVGLQRLILEQGTRKKRADEIHHMRRRQDIVDRYVQAAEGPATLRAQGTAYQLPALASPQPVHLGLYEAGGVARKRAAQAKAFGASFLGGKGGLRQFAYDVLDEGMHKSEARRKSLSRLQKLFWSKTRKSNFIWEPLRAAVRALDESSVDNKVPLRVLWRETQVSAGKLRVDLYFIYPNVPDQYEEGFKTWMGARNVVEL